MNDGTILFLVILLDKTVFELRRSPLASHKNDSNAPWPAQPLPGARARCCVRSRFHVRGTENNESGGFVVGGSRSGVRGDRCSPVWLRRFVVVGDGGLNVDDHDDGGRSECCKCDRDKCTVKHRISLAAG